MKVDGFLDDLTSYLLSNLAKIFIHFQLANIKSFQDLEKFLRWFCANVGLGLQLGNKIAEYGDELFGSQVSCKMYFEQYLLLSRTKLLVLV
ncbi:AAA-like domain-containing protein [Microcoleus sp. MOSTC5]|uniref:AAA-like domain-containing protein n=1 Tax=Microcoleus sp. MOSTC5 TaxID=3055378 RepID=UPI002FD00B17